MPSPNLPAVAADVATSLLAVMVPEADPVIGHLREQYDPAAARGLGAHVTIRYPFLLPARIDLATLESLARAATSVAAFDFQLQRVARFPTTFYLEPEPAAPFQALRAAVDRAFGERLPPDPFPEFVPHLSIARNVGRATRRVAARAHAALLDGPIYSHCSDLAIVESENGPSPWMVRLRIALGR
jgi:2'-5' RNA ligase